MSPDPAHGTPSDPEPREYVVRRAPRLSAVVGLSAALGLVLALLATTAVHAGAEPLLDPYSGAPLTFASTFGYMAVAWALGCIVLGLLVWLLLDRRSRRTQRTVVLERISDTDGRTEQ